MVEVIRNNEGTKQSKLIFKADIARHLLHNGCRIIDIKPDKLNKAKTVFVFENDLHFKDAFDQLINDIQDERQKARRKERKDSDKEDEKKED